MDEVFLAIGSDFTAEAYMFSTKCQGVLWSLADVVLVVAALRIADLARAHVHKRKILFRYLLLWISAALVPFLLFTETKEQFFVLESFICGMQFVILVYTALLERKGVLAFVWEVILR